MTQQAPLFDPSHHGEPCRDSALLRIDAPSGSAALSKAQKTFNRLIAKIDGQRQLLASWQDFLPQFQTLVTKDLQPLQKRIDEQRLALAMLFDRAHDSRGVNRRECAKLADLVSHIVDDLLTRSNEPALVALHDKYSAISHEEAQQEEAEFLKAMAANVFGVEVDEELADLASPDEMMAAIARKMQQQAASGSAEADGDGVTDDGEQRGDGGPATPQGARRNGSPKSPQAQAREARQQAQAQGATQSVREVYRKLASALHPDRETDPAERARKTTLMQRVNQAYEKKDLLQLLELQMQAEQIDAARLAELSEGRLKHYIAVLKEQSRELENELVDLTEPFSSGLPFRRAQMLTPQNVVESFRSELAGARRELQELREELAAFEDPRQLKAWLKHYRISQVDFGDPFGDGFDELASPMKKKPRRRR